MTTASGRACAWLTKCAQLDTAHVDENYPWVLCCHAHDPSMCSLKCRLIVRVHVPSTHLRIQASSTPHISASVKYAPGLNQVCQPKRMHACGASTLAYAHDQAAPEVEGAMLCGWAVPPMAPPDSIRGLADVGCGETRVGGPPPAPAGAGAGAGATGQAFTSPCTLNWVRAFNTGMLSGIGPQSMVASGGSRYRRASFCNL